MRKILISFLGFSILVGSFSGCFLFKKNVKDLGPEAFLPKDSAIVFVVDHTNDAQTENLKEFFNKFPYRGDLEKFIKEDYEKGEVAKEFSYEDFEAIFSGKWKMAFGAEGSYMMVAFKPEEAEGFQKFLESLISDEFNKTLSGKYIVYWDKENDPSAFIAKYKDFFFVANDKKMFEKSIENAESGDGFGDESFVVSNLEELGKDNFGYVYVNMKKFAEVEMEFESFPSANDYLSKITEDSFAVFATDGKAIKVLGKSYLSDEGKKEDLSHELSFVDKVPAWNPIIYIEDFPLSQVVQMINDSLQNTSQPVDLFQKLADLTGIDAEGLKKTLKAPFAFVVSDLGVQYPTASFYMQVDDENLENAKKLSDFVTNYIDVFAKQFGANLGSGNLVKKDIVPFKGGTLAKFSVDWKVLSADDFAGLNATYQSFMGSDEGQDINQLRLELYSGVAGDGLFVVSLYPDFVENFGKDLITENEDYKAFLPEIKDYYGNGGFYLLSGRNLGAMAAEYLGMAKFAGAVSADDYMMVEKIIDFASMVRSVVISQSIGDESVKHIIYFGTDGANFEAEVVETESGAVMDSGAVIPEKVEKEKVKR